MNEMNEQEKKWEEEHEEWWRKEVHPIDSTGNFFLVNPFLCSKASYLQACRNRQEEMEKEIRRYRLVIRKLTLGLDEFWINSPEGKAVKEEVQKLFKEEK